MALHKPCVYRRCFEKPEITNGSNVLTSIVIILIIIPHDKYSYSVLLVTDLHHPCIYFVHVYNTSPFSVVVSDSLHHHNLTFPSSPSIIPNLMNFHQSVQCLKLDLAVMRTEHHTKMSEIQFQLTLAKQTLQTALKGNSVRYYYAF